MSFLPLTILFALAGLYALWRKRRARTEALDLDAPPDELRHSPDTLRRIALPPHVVNREAARIAVEVSRAVAEVGTRLAPGQSTLEIAQRVASLLPPDMIPAMLGLNGFPAAVAVSVNEEVLHGIPSANRRIEAGDIVKIQLSAATDLAFGAIGWTFPVGALSPDAQRLVDAGLSALRNAVAIQKGGVRTGDIGATIQETVESQGFAVVRDFVGYTMGAELIQPPQIPCYGTRGAGPRLPEGTVVNLHVIAKQGQSKVRVLEDEWTVAGNARELSVVFTAMVELGKDGVQVLTTLV